MFFHRLVCQVLKNVESDFQVCELDYSLHVDDAAAARMSVVYDFLSRSPSASGFNQASFFTELLVPRFFHFPRQVTVLTGYRNGNTLQDFPF